MPEKCSKKTGKILVDEFTKETKKALEYLKEIRQDLDKKRQVA